MKEHFSYAFRRKTTNSLSSHFPNLWSLKMANVEQAACVLRMFPNLSVGVNV